ncbi:hypothetical protein [Methylobacterium sp. Leaf456]|uniref:hypothetical protein n=1 Tax=Methylobacterium sp. Leaf456 TaxID=1736382 RepID=UPI0012E33A53|nr:hypothetical protein [Methylobacterium sp. Leaf456]
MPAKRGNLQRPGRDLATLQETFRNGISGYRHHNPRQHLRLDFTTGRNLADLHDDTLKIIDTGTSAPVTSTLDPPFPRHADTALGT